MVPEMKIARREEGTGCINRLPALGVFAAVTNIIQIGNEIRDSISRAFAKERRKPLEQNWMGHFCLFSELLFFLFKRNNYNDERYETTRGSERPASERSAEFQSMFIINSTSVNEENVEGLKERQ